MQKKDIILNESYDVAIVNGDFVIGDNLNQELGCLLAAKPGDFKQSPLTGIDLQSHLLNEGTDELNRKIRLVLKKEGLQLNTLTFKNGQIIIDVSRKK